MTTNYRDRLFDSYHATHVAYLDGSDAEKLAWFDEYARRVYLPHLALFDRAQSSVLDIGCNKGYLLAVLAGLGFQKLAGIDLSPEDVAKAQTIAPGAQLACVDALDYLSQHEAAFDLIFIKAVVEHIQKHEIIPLLEQIQRALRPGGAVLVDVPNMDWFFAPHERYMDFTHEVGFTRESLGQVMRNVFADVQITPVETVRPDLPGMINLKRKIARLILGKLLAWADPESIGLSMWSRSILAVGRK
jgi:2-polyprenyl-3-methyl-5-hydroxy-6-metoxy-1,4-benzoquinol methylase